MESPSKRDAILAAALDLFCRHGFDGTSVPMIAERAGVGTGTIYRYFASKEALVNVLFRLWKERFGQAMLQGYPAHEPARRRFAFLWQRMAGWAVNNPTAFAFLEMHHHTPYLDQESYAVAEGLMGFMRAFIDEAVAQQIVKPLPADAHIAILFGAFVGLFKAAQAGEFALTPELLSAAENCCWEAIRQ